MDIAIPNLNTALSVVPDDSPSAFTIGSPLAVQPFSPTSLITAPTPKEQADAKITCNNYRRICDRPGIEVKSGSQGRAYIGCPTTTTIIKDYPLKKIVGLHGDVQDLSIYANMCRNLMDLNKLNLPNLVVTQECTNCFNITNLDNSNIVVIQERANGVSLSGFIDKSTPVILTRNLLPILAQILGVIHQLYTHQIYHNDVHVDNIILADMPEDITLSYTINTLTYTMTRKSCDHLVKLIDYGLVTKEHPRDTHYNELTELNLLPFMDIAQILNTVSNKIKDRRHNASGSDIPPLETLEKHISTLYNIIIASSLGMRRTEIVMKDNLTPAIYMSIFDTLNKLMNQPVQQGGSKFKIYKLIG